MIYRWYFSTQEQRDACVADGIADWHEIDQDAKKITATETHASDFFDTEQSIADYYHQVIVDTDQYP